MKFLRKRVVTKRTYLAGEVIKYNDTYYQAFQNLEKGTDLSGIGVERVLDAEGNVTSETHLVLEIKLSAAYGSLEIHLLPPRIPKPREPWMKTTN